LRKIAALNLLRLKSRRAGHLMKTLGPAELQIEKAFLVRRHVVLAVLEAARRGQPYSFHFKIAPGATRAELQAKNV
jgi:hypothetical protein